MFHVGFNSEALEVVGSGSPCERSIGFHDVIFDYWQLTYLVPSTNVNSS